VQEPFQFSDFVWAMGTSEVTSAVRR